MKELSIEEKAKRYDEALVRANEMIKDMTNIGGVAKVDDIQYIFPELAESEDEKARKEITELVMQPTWKTEKEFHRRKELCAWLEKQGEQKHVCSKEDKVTRNRIIGYLKQDVEEHSERKERINEMIAYLEKQGEQKHTDKVEPKFKVGDWVVFNNKHQSIYQVEKIEDGYYILRHTHGGTFRVCVLHDESLRLWTIEDAKDGDVLMCKDNGYNSYILFGEKNIYCWYNGQTEHFHPATSCSKLRKDATFYPATKEQRDTLFAKMKEAGYEWDAEKKELKKIEQKPAWSEKDEKKLNLAL